MFDFGSEEELINYLKACSQPIVDFFKELSNDSPENYQEFVQFTPNKKTDILDFNTQSIIRIKTNPAISENDAFNASKETQEKMDKINSMALMNCIPYLDAQTVDHSQHLFHGSEAHTSLYRKQAYDLIIMQKDIYFIKNGYLYNISYSSPKENFLETQTAANEILDTLTFR